jgi:hypothetical protein
MPNPTLIISTVPVGRDPKTTEYLVSVHVSPRQISDQAPSILSNWARDIVSGKVTFSVTSPELAGPLPAKLDMTLIHTDLWAEFFQDLTGAAVAPAKPSSPSRPDVGYLNVSLKSTLDNADDFYQSYVAKVDVTSQQGIADLHNNAVTVAFNHSVYGLINPPGGQKAPGTDVRTYLKGNVGKKLGATRIFGNVNVDAAFPSQGVPQTLNPNAEAEIDKIHHPSRQNVPQPQTGQKLAPSSRQHVVHHMNRLRGVSRKAPANIALSSLHATAASSGSSPVHTPMGFGERLTLLQGMPVLLEALGLVLIFRVPSTFNVGGVQTLRTEVFYNGQPDTYSSMTVVSPLTAVNGSLFLPQPQPVNVATHQNPRVRPDNGYIDVTANYLMGSLQVESAANHVYNFANRAVMRLNSPANSQAQAVTVKANEDYTHVILPPSPHTDGLYVYQHGRQNQILDKLKDQSSASLPTTDTVKYAEDLFHSFAVDMKDAKATDWSRLTLRNETYFKRNDMDHPIIPTEEREHGVRTSGTRPTDTVPTASSEEVDEAGKHQIDETIFTWRGGSLALKDSSNTPIGSQSNGSLSTQAIPWVNAFRGKFELPKGVVIPAQLFGGSYAFALRPVYITGRARPFDQTAAAASIVPNAPRFLRNEMVLGPKLIKKASTGSQHSDTQNLMFVSSHVDNPQAVMAANQMTKLKVSADIERSRRYIVPAPCTSKMASRHGMSDSAIKAGSTTVLMKKGPKGDKDGALPDTFPILPGDVDKTTTYIPDPMCDGVRATLFFIGNAPLPNAGNQLSKTLQYYRNQSWPDFTHHVVELRRGKPGSPVTLAQEDTSWDGDEDVIKGKSGSQTIVCTLPPGMTAVLELTPTIAGSFQDVHAFAPQATALENTTICRPTILRMTHGTDVPVTIPDFKLDGAVRQMNGSAPIVVNGMELYSFDRSSCSSPGVTTTYEPYTTGKVTIEASWTEMVDSPGSTAQPLPARMSQKAAIFSQQLPKLKASNVGSDIGSIYDTDDSCPSSSGCSSASTGSAPCPTANLPFRDARYRRVELAMSGVSRYESVISNKTARTTANRKILCDFLSTAVPPVPNVEYVLPTFEWQFGKKFHQHTQTRKCGLSVMLNRPWFASGEGEQLAVLVPPSSQFQPSQIPKRFKVPLPSQYPPLQGMSVGIEESVSAWGSHAIWNFAENSAMTINIDNAPSYSSLNIGGQSYNFALFDPVYDEVEDRWYCNISFSDPPVYGTLIRLIVARYQPHAANPALMLSAPLIVDFALLNPTRVITAKRSGFSSVDVTITGVGAYGTQGGLLNQFTVQIASEKDHDMTEFPWREPEVSATAGTKDVTNPILWHGVLKFDPLATNTVVAREYEQFPAFEVQTKPELRKRLVYASAINIPPLL